MMRRNTKVGVTLSYPQTSRQGHDIRNVGPCSGRLVKKKKNFFIETATRRPPHPLGCRHVLLEAESVESSGV